MRTVRVEIYALVSSVNYERTAIDDIQPTRRDCDGKHHLTLAAMMQPHRATVTVSAMLGTRERIGEVF